MPRVWGATVALIQSMMIQCKAMQAHTVPHEPWTNLWAFLPLKRKSIFKFRLLSPSRNIGELFQVVENAILTPIHPIY